MANDKDRIAIAKDFEVAVNMTAAQIERWLDTNESKSVGNADGENKSGPGGKESVGHASGRHIVAIKRKKKADLTDADYDHMQKVVGFVHRHIKQRPHGNIEESRWRYSLMNWGHDPTRPT